MRNRKIIIAGAVSTLLVVGAGIVIYNYIQHLNTYEKGIQEPVKNGLPFEVVRFEVENGLEFHRPNGTHVVIPKDAIVDSKGRKVEGQVQFKFREMHNAQEIFLSGIPMQMNEQRNKYLQSMGMMEARVFKGSEELYLAPGKELKIDLAVDSKPDDNFKLWHFKNDEEWEVSGTFQTNNNERRDRALANLPTPQKPIKPKKDILFQLASDKSMPHLDVWNGVDWKLILKDGQKPPYRAFRINWDKIDIQLIKPKKKLYSITFSTKKMDHKGKIFSESITVLATPNVKKKEFKRLMAQYEEELDKFADVLKNRELEEERLLQESALLNSFSSNGFGVYNIDKLEDTRVLAKMNATFDFEDDLNAKVNKVKLMMICSKQNTVLTYNAFDWDELPLIDDDVELVASLPNGTFAYVSDKEFNKKVKVKKMSRYFENEIYFETRKLRESELKNLMSLKRGIS